MRILRICILAAVLGGLTTGVAAWAYWNFAHYGSVEVVDQAGNSVAGVEVFTIALSMGQRAGVTDSRGQSTFRLETMLQPTRWISLEKPGYDPIQVEVPSHWPLYITLAPAGTASRGVQLTPRP